MGFKPERASQAISPILCSGEYPGLAIVSNPNGLPRPFRQNLQDLMCQHGFACFKPERASQAISPQDMNEHIKQNIRGFKPERASQAISPRGFDLFFSYNFLDSNPNGLPRPFRL